MEIALLLIVSVVAVAFWCAVAWALNNWRHAYIVGWVVVGLMVVGAMDRDDQARKRSREQQAQEERARTDAFQKAEAARWALVKPDDIEIRNAAFVPFFKDNFTATGSFRNSSPLRVTTVELDITALDCHRTTPPLELMSTGAPRTAAPGDRCDIIGQGRQTFSSDIPPGQVRGFSGTLTLRDFPAVQGRLIWTAKPVRVRADAGQS